jgi:bifunctional UDP-N-acetylglucosamine pyrophosphorylase / glucosamine-1-phosphate N-acetyltransferase
VGREARGRVLVIPAAGRGSRLGVPLPKALVPVGGRPMLAWLLDLYRDYVDAVVVVAHPSTHALLAEALAPPECRGIVVDQASPTGMLDAVLIGCRAAAPWSPERIWVTWCDQVAVRPETVARLAAAEPGTALTMPLVTRDAPYIHFDRDADGRITAVRQRREGDAMPARGDSDMGLFSLSAGAATLHLPAFASAAAPDRGTGERNFLPFVPWLAARARVATLAATDAMEAVGVNTPEELAAVEAWLLRR